MIRRLGKGAQATCPPSIADTYWMVGTLRFADPTKYCADHRPTRFNSAVSASSASASITPPHSVIRSGITMRFAGG